MKREFSSGINKVLHHIKIKFWILDPALDGSRIFHPQGGMVSLQHKKSRFETVLMIDAGSWWILMPDSDSQWPMHTVSLCYQTIIIEREVQSVEGAEVSGERRPGGYLSHELSGAMKADCEERHSGETNGP